MPKVSIVLPSFNGSTYIKKSIESIINQGYTDWELIIVDDCSTDETLQIAYTYAEKDARIKVHHNETNQKLPESLNIGFRQAAGKYFTWTSDDNLYMPTTIGRLVEFMDTHPDCGLCYADYMAINAQGEEAKEYKMPEPEQIVTSNVVGACFMYRASVAHEIGEYDTSLFLAEDYDYWMRFARTSKLMHIPETLYLYREHENSLTQTRWQKVNDAVSKLWERNWEYILNALIEPVDKEAFLRKYYTFSLSKKEAMKKIAREDKSLARTMKFENLKNAYPRLFKLFG